MSQIKYTEKHEWLALDGDLVKVGITDFAQAALGDLVFVELPETDTAYNAGDEAAVIESVKAAGDISVPVAGTVVEVNESIAEEPELVNRDPMGEGWFFKLRIDEGVNLDELMSEAEYQELIEE